PVLSTLKLDSAANPILISSNTHKEIQTNRLIDVTKLNLTADSIRVTYSLLISSDDNEEDYLPIFAPIDFRKNDQTSRTFSISNYYAYDDGIAEYGANITGAGTQLAYQFDMSTNKQDTIVGIDLFFPKFGDETNQNIQLHILDALTGNQSDYLFQKIIPVERSNRNDKTIFKRVDIPGGVVVKNTFYLGWKLTSAAEIPIGLDANNDSGEKIFVNSSGSWIQNKTLKGSLMIRPVFGKPKDLTTSVAESASAKPFPNPTQQRFFLPNEAKEIQLYTVTGSSVSFEQTDGFDHKEITISHPVPGLYLVRYFNQVWHTEKIMVAP
ncbi:MAG: T9SS type A sorting domain-containing protein, partial [Cyclobacteriaceae bacterium]